MVTLMSFDNGKADESVPDQTDLSRAAGWKCKFNGQGKTKPSFKPKSRCLELPSTVWRAAINYKAEHEVFAFGENTTLVGYI